MKFRSLIKTVLVSVLVLAAANTLSAKIKNNQSGNASSVGYDQQWLGTYYDVPPFSESVSADDFNEDLAAVTGSPIINGTKWDAAEAVEVSVKAAGLDELALTYKEAKAKLRLAYYGIKEVTGLRASYLACALDSGLISADTYRQAENKVTASLAAELVMQVACIQGKGPDALGFTTDPDILDKIANRFKTVALYQNKELDTIGTKLVIDKVSTGYNLKKSVDDARFLPALTLRYGHSSEQHALQLTALLNSENIKARIQIEPKTSIYEYLPEWGTPAPSSAYIPC